MAASRVNTAGRISQTQRASPRIQTASIEGGFMRAEYYVVGGVVLLAVYFGARLLPDLVRYMKIRSM
jgi:hypothetical protein